MDHKQYRYIELPNRLKVLLINDPQSDLSSVAMNVAVGSWNEPKEHPGLAHLLEHMLFEGSSSFPSQNFFQNLVSNGGGDYSASTTKTNANFYFNVDSKLLEKSL